MSKYHSRWRLLLPTLIAAGLTTAGIVYLIKRKNACTLAGNMHKPLLTVGESSRDSVLSLKNQGNAEFNNKNYDKAIEFYSMALRQGTDNCADAATIYSNRAACHAMKKDWQNVVEDCSRALDINPRYEKALERRSKAYEMLKDYSNAIFDCGLVLALCNENCPNHVIQRFEGMIKISADIAQRKTPIVFAYPSKYVANDIWELLVDLKDFINTGQKTAKNEPVSNAEMLEMLANHKYESAEVLIKKIITDTTEYPPQYDQIYACLLFIKGDFDSALEHINTTLKTCTDPAPPYLYIISGLIKMEMENIEGCLEDLNKVLQSDNDNATCQLCLGDIYLMNSDVYTAQNFFLKVKENNPTYAPAYIHLYRCYSLQLKHEDALQVLKQALKNCSRTAELYFALADACTSLNKFTEALSALNSAKSLDPDNPMVYLGFFAYEIARNNKEKAFNYLNCACDKDPLFISPRMQLVQYNLINREYSQAVANIDKCLQATHKPAEIKSLCCTREVALLMQRMAALYPDLVEAMSKILGE